MVLAREDIIQADILKVPEDTAESLLVSQCWNPDSNCVLAVDFLNRAVKRIELQAGQKGRVFN